MLAAMMLLKQRGARAAAWHPHWRQQGDAVPHACEMSYS